MTTLKQPARFDAAPSGQPKRFPRWKTIYRDLLQQIQPMRHGEQLTILKEICRRYQVSLITARRVADELAKGGHVENRRKVGIIVTKRPAKMMIKLVLSRNLRPEELLSGRSAIMRLYEGMARRAQELDISLAFAGESGLPVLLQGCDGCTGFLIHQEVRQEAFEWLKARKAPFMSFPFSNSGEPCVTHDLKKGMYLAARHLLALGHRRIALLSGAITSAWFFPRYKGYLRALRSARIPFDWALVKETSGLDAMEDEQVLQTWLRLPSPPTAVLAANDERAIRLLEYCARQGIRVPQDLNVVGFDNITESANTCPALTTVDTHLDLIGVESVNQLATMISGGRGRSAVIKPDMVVRCSTAPAGRQSRTAVRRQARPTSNKTGVRGKHHA